MSGLEWSYIFLRERVSGLLLNSEIVGSIAEAGKVTNGFAKNCSVVICDRLCKYRKGGFCLVV